MWGYVNSPIKGDFSLSKRILDKCRAGIPNSERDKPIPQARHFYLGVCVMKNVFFAKPLRCSLAALALVNLCPVRALAQQSHAHVPTGQRQELAVSQPSNTNALIKIVRESTARFQDVSVAEREGYTLQFGCVSGSDSGAMGLHYVNGALVGSGVIDATRPQIVIYEPKPNGDLKLIGADYLVLADTWNAQHSDGPPQLMGQLFHYFESPNRFGSQRFIRCTSGLGRKIQMVRS
jgi:hypothetical protein